MVGTALPAWALGVPFVVGGDSALGAALVVTGLLVRVGLEVWIRLCSVGGGARAIVAVMTATVLVSTALVISGVVLIALEVAG